MNTSQPTRQNPNPRNTTTIDITGYPAKNLRRHPLVNQTPSNTHRIIQMLKQRKPTGTLIPLIAN